jgi:hypothetical protein
MQSSFPYNIRHDLRRRKDGEKMKRIVRRLIDAVVIRFFHSRILHYCAWLEYESGFSGKGTTLLDKKPSFPKPWIPSCLRRRFEKDKEEWAKIKSDAFRKACIDVLGEDPDTDWY